MARGTERGAADEERGAARRKAPLRGHFGQRGEESSSRQIGPSTKNGPSNFTKAGTEPPSTQNFRSGGSLPATFAKTPAMPPTSRSTRYRVAVRRESPTRTGSSPTARIVVFTSRGFGVQANNCALGMHP